MKNFITKNKFQFLLLFIIFVLSACGGDVISFQAGDIRDDFCGVHLNYQYCKCAFHNDFCDVVAMSKGEAKKYVNEEYDKWIEKEKLNFAGQCRNDNGIYDDGSCEYCDDDKEVIDGKCEKTKKTESEDDNVKETKGECKYDDDCNAICDGNIMWKMGCNARDDTCEKTFDTDCASNRETFGDLSFQMVCKSGECIRDNAKIKAKRGDLEIEKKKDSDELKALNAKRDSLKNVMLDANKNCLNGLANMTNVAIVEFATRVASITAGGIPDLASASVDYFGDALNKLYAYTKDVSPSEEQKLKPNEYIKLNCDLYDYFKTELDDSDEQLDEILEDAKRVDGLLKDLPIL